jgi:hypothetical protein
LVSKVLDIYKEDFGQKNCSASVCALGSPDIKLCDNAHTKVALKLTLATIPRPSQSTFLQRFPIHKKKLRRGAFSALQ